VACRLGLEWMRQLTMFMYTFCGQSLTGQIEAAHAWRRTQAHQRALFNRRALQGTGCIPPTQVLSAQPFSSQSLRPPTSLATRFSSVPTATAQCQCPVTGHGSATGNAA